MIILVTSRNEGKTNEELTEIAENIKKLYPNEDVALYHDSVNSCDISTWVRNGIVKK
jgi:hypothetical protein